MDFLNTAKGLMGNGGGDGGMNPLAMFQALDKNGDGKITESGIIHKKNLIYRSNFGNHA
jgi:hypothetical protein